MTTYIETIPAPQRCELCGQILVEADDPREQHTDAEVLKALAELNHVNPTDLDILLERVGYSTPYEILGYRWRITPGAVRKRARALAVEYPGLASFLVKR